MSALVGSIQQGFAHVGASVGEWVGPGGLRLPDGIDHVLFLLALALGSHSFWEMLKNATGFTLGHSITLAMAALGVVHPPSRWVEAAIALSIVYLAVENLLSRESRHRGWIAAAFGLVHGFGFASALQNARLSQGEMLKVLFGFNLGVEIGQAAILLTFVSLVRAMRQEPLLERYGLRPISWGVLGTGAYWFMVRIAVQ